MNKAYDKVTWVNKPSTASPLNQTNLNKMSDALDIIDDRVIALDSGKVSSVTVTNTLPTGDTIATITVDGTSTNIKSAQITVDSEISTTSTNPVQNKVIAEALREVMPEVTVEGNPISITDGSNIVPAKLAEVTFLPKQDLHGYDNPWVGGAGKNKLQVTASSTTVSDVVITIDDNGVIDAHGTASGTIALVVGEKTFDTDTSIIYSGSVNGSSSTHSVNILDATTSQYFGDVYNGDSSAKTALAGHTLRFYIVIRSGEQCNHLKLYPMIRLSTVADGTFAPYENICPISGWTEVNLERTGKNLYNPDNTFNGYTNNGVITASNNFRTVYCKCVPNTTYTVRKMEGKRFRVGTIDNPIEAGVEYYDLITDDTATSITITTNNHAKYLIAFVYNANADTVTAEQMLASVQIEVGSQASAYEPYQGETYTEPLGDTYYGGKVDFVSGTAIITHLITTINDLGWIYNSTNSTFTSVSLSNKKNGNLNVISSAYKTSESTSVGNMNDGEIKGRDDNYYIYLKDLRYTTQNELKQGMGSTQICYELATPIEITLTAEQISLLKGNNVISTDGDNIILIYSADIKAWVESQLSNS